MIQTILTTERLQLLPFTADDYSFLLDLHSDPEVNRYLPSGPIALTPEEVRQRLNRYMESNRNTQVSGWKLATHDGTAIGRAGFFRMKDPNGYELGYVLKRSAWGRGYASEITSALISWFFEHTTEDCLFAYAEQVHAASLRVMAKAGMHPWQDRGVEGLDFRFYRITRAQFDCALE